MFLCNIHGKQPAVICCEHLLDAVKKSQPLAYSISVDSKILGKKYLCADCRKRWDLLTPENDDLRVELADELKAVCVGCFKEWESKTAPKP